MDATPTTTRRRRFRVSLRALLLVIAVVGLCLGWVVNKIYRQRKAIAVIKANGGLVGYDWFIRPGELYPHPNPPEPPGPRWLRRILGNELFQDIETVNLSDRNLRRSHDPSADVLEWTVRGAPRICALQVDRFGLSEPAYRAIGKLRSLERLDLDHEDPTDVEFSYLSNLTNLKELHISSGRRLTDSAIESISRLPNLESLTICDVRYGGSLDAQVVSSGRHLTDRALESLSNLPSLRSLSICDLNLTNRGLEHLSRFKKLKQLYLNAEVSKVSSDGLKHLRGLASLENIGIYAGEWEIVTPPFQVTHAAAAEAIDRAIKKSDER